MKIQEQHWTILAQIIFLDGCEPVVEIEVNRRFFGVDYKETTSHYGHDVGQRDRQRQIQEALPYPAPSVSLINGKPSNLDRWEGLVRNPTIIAFRTMVLLRNLNLAAYQGDVASNVTPCVDGNVASRHVFTVERDRIIFQEGFQRSERGVTERQGSCPVLRVYRPDYQLLLVPLIALPHGAEKVLFRGDLHTDSEVSCALHIAICNQLPGTLDRPGRTGIGLIFITNVSVQPDRIVTGHLHAAKSISFYAHIILQPTSEGLHDLAEFNKH